MNLRCMTWELQMLANEGYALHDVEIHSRCGDCDSDVVIENPELVIIRDNENKTVKLKFVSAGD